MYLSKKATAHVISLTFLPVLLILTLFWQEKTAFAHEGKNENQVIIHIDKDGFEPKKIKIDPGTEVVFENVGGDDHWPASDNHPTHTLYDGTNLNQHCDGTAPQSFDSCGPVPAGESWSFVFDKAGVFTYHDHLWPHLGGEVVVGDVPVEEHDDRNIFSWFLDFIYSFFASMRNLFSKDPEEPVLNPGNAEGAFYEKLQGRYENMVLESDPRQAILALQEESSENSHVLALCHDVLHGIGRAAYDKYGSFKEAVKYQSDFCNSGYVHGVFESYFASSNEPLSGLAEECLGYASLKGRKFDLWQCHHGVGHGFMFLTGGDLEESLGLCEKSLVSDAASSCQNGVYMELFNQEILAKESDYIDSKNPFLTCANRNKAKSDCYLYAPSYLVQKSGLSFAEVFEECGKAELGYRRFCHQGVGSEAIKRNMKDIASVFTLCRLAGSLANQRECVVGASGTYMNQKGSYEAGIEFCEQAPREFYNTCAKTVASAESFFE